MPQLSPSEVTDLCTTALNAWRSLPSKAKQAFFEWRDMPYVAKHSGFRLLVDKPDGTPVACRWD